MDISISARYSAHAAPFPRLLALGPAMRGDGDGSSCGTSMGPMLHVRPQILELQLQSNSVPTENIWPWLPKPKTPMHTSLALG